MNSNKLQIGDTYKTIVSYTQKQVEEFARLSGDHNPIHLDKDYAATTVFKRPIIHGSFSMSIFSKIMGMEFPGQGSVYIDHTISFLRPMYVETAYRVEIEILELDAKRHTAKMRTDIFDDTTGKQTIRGINTVMHKEKI